MHVTYIACRIVSADRNGPKQTNVAYNFNPGPSEGTNKDDGHVCHGRECLLRAQQPKINPILVLIKRSQQIGLSIVFTKRGRDIS